MLTDFGLCGNNEEHLRLPISLLSTKSTVCEILVNFNILSETQSKAIYQSSAKTTFVFLPLTITYDTNAYCEAGFEIHLTNRTERAQS